MNPMTIGEVRVEIARLQADLQKTRDAPFSNDETRTKIQEWVANCATLGEARIAFQVEACANNGGHIEFNDLLTVDPGGRDDRIHLLPVLAALLGPAVVSKSICRHLARIEGGLPVVERAARVMAIKAEIGRLGHIEESLVEDFAAAGTPIARRPDADPKIVLRLTRPE